MSKELESIVVGNSKFEELYEFASAAGQLEGFIAELEERAQDPAKVETIEEYINDCFESIFN